MDDDRVEIVLDIDGDYVAGGADVEAKRLEKSTSLIKHLPSVSKRHRVGPLDTKESTVSHALKGLKLVSKNGSLVVWSVAEKRFDELSENGLLKRSQLGECIVIDTDSTYFFERWFDSLCLRSNMTDELINKAHLKEFWEYWNNRIANQSFDLRLRTFFDIVDKDGDDRITKDEVKEIISLLAKDNQLPYIANKVDEYAILIMEELDKDNLGYITIECLETLLFQESTHTATGESHNFSQLLSQKFKTTDHESKSITRRYKDLKYFLHRNWKRCWVVVLWIGIMAGLFTWKYIEYKHRAVYHVLGSCVCIAKGAAETLKLNMAIMLLPVCRKTITWLRNKTNLGVVVPFDDNINFHQVIAVAITVGVGLHAISHLACDFPRLIHATEEEYKPMQRYFGDQAQNYWHFVKEVEWYTGVIMIVLMTIAFTLAWLRQGITRPLFFEKLKKLSAFKKSKRYDAFVDKLWRSISVINPYLKGFKVFWYSHHLFVIVYALLIVHGIKLYLIKEWYKKTTWMYLAVPILLYACERLIRTFRSRLISTTSLLLRKVIVYPGNVLSLHMEKPEGFNYKSGQYMFVKYTPISQFEWHPFSITSAPDDDYLSVHIRAFGDWTKEINKIFRVNYSLTEGTERYTYDFEDDRNNPKILIDGPYGAPSTGYEKYNVMLLVGLGIGATPMISIVKDILNNQKAKMGLGIGATRAYFYWVTGQPDTSNWVKGVMNDVAEKDKNGVIEMHCYCKTANKEDDTKSAFNDMLRKSGSAKEGVDVVSNTRVMSHSGKPNWPDVYDQIALKHKNSKIGVFYCGPPTGISDQKKLCFSHKTSTCEFVFHKENF